MVALSNKGLAGGYLTQANLSVTTSGLFEVTSLTHKNWRASRSSSAIEIIKNAFSISAVSAIGYDRNLKRISIIFWLNFGPAYRQSLSDGPPDLAEHATSSFTCHVLPPHDAVDSAPCGHNRSLHQGQQQLLRSPQSDGSYSCKIVRFSFRQRSKHSSLLELKRRLSGSGAWVPFHGRDTSYLCSTNWIFSLNSSYTDLSVFVIPKDSNSQNECRQSS